MRRGRESSRRSEGKRLPVREKSWDSKTAGVSDMLYVRNIILRSL